MTPVDWDRYDHWNGVLASHLFGVGQCELPAYIDVDDALLGRCADELGIASSKGRTDLVEVVRSSLGLARTPLAEHEYRFLDWRRGLAAPGVAVSKRARSTLGPPPVVALLTVLVLAAERMGSNAQVAAHAYYARLNEVLGLDRESGRRLRGRFWVTESFWRGLNDYLDQNEGRLGLPTAYALGHRYVGIPQSQAVVRAGDRARLPQFFQMFGLPPGSQLIPADLEPLLDGWIRTTPSPVSANLQRLWRSGPAKERIAGVVAVELAHWDGTSRDAAAGVARVAGSLRLTALLRQTFGGQRLELSLLARFPTPSEPAALRIRSAEHQPLIGVVPAAGGRVRPTPGSELDASSLVGSVVDLEDPTTCERVTRRPRRVVPFRRDELVGALVEVDRVELADDVILLVRDDPALVEQAGALLAQCGHLGTVYTTDGGADSQPLPGLPPGWALLNDVQLYGVPQGVQAMDLQVLVPLTTAQLTLAGGLKLPGRIRKWSTLEPPEVRAVVAEATTLRMRMSTLGEGRVTLHDWTVSAPALVRPLADLGLGDGDYEIELFVNGDSTPVTASTLRLRSSNTPDAVSWETCTRLNYELDADAIVALSAVVASDESLLAIDGVNTVGARPSPVQATVPAPAGAGWEITKGSESRLTSPIVLGTADPTSCMVTGAHYVELPTSWGNRTSGRIEGRCRYCGLVKTYPARPKWRKVTGTAPAEPTLRLEDMPSHKDTSVGWDSCLDGLVHVGGGSIAALERIATQAEASSLFVDTFVRAFEALGHIDVRRDDYLQPVEWEANPAYLAETAGRGFVLAGAWSRAARERLGTCVSRAGGRLTREPRDGAPSTWLVAGLDAQTLTAVVADIDADAHVVTSAVARMLDALPPLSEVEAALLSARVPYYRSATVFDVATARWMPTPGVGAPGAYRLDQSFRRVSIWMSPEDAPQRTARLGTVQLVKHLAARRQTRPLVGYLARQQVLVVPLGADLPGLYGRAVALCSGRMPQVGRSSRALGYPGVPQWVADRVTALLRS